MGAGQVAPGDPADIAVVAAAALTAAGHDGHGYELTGGPLMDAADMVAAPSDVLGRPPAGHPAPARADRMDWSRLGCGGVMSAEDWSPSGLPVGPCVGVASTDPDQVARATESQQAQIL